MNNAEAISCIQFAGLAAATNRAVDFTTGGHMRGGERDSEKCALSWLRGGNAERACSVCEDMSNNVYGVLWNNSRGICIVSIKSKSCEGLCGFVEFGVVKSLFDVHRPHVPPGDFPQKRPKYGMQSK
jgi:hypothetical protein